MCTSWCSIWVTIIPKIHKNKWWKIRKSLKITTNLKRNGKLFCTASISCKGFYKNENSLLAIFWDQQMQWSPLKNRHTTPSKFQSINKNTRHRLDTLVHSHIKKFLIETLRWGLLHKSLQGIWRSIGNPNIAKIVPFKKTFYYSYNCSTLAWVLAFFF